MASNDHPTRSSHGHTRPFRWHKWDVVTIIVEIHINLRSHETQHIRAHNEPPSAEQLVTSIRNLAEHCDDIEDIKRMNLTPGSFSEFREAAKRRAYDFEANSTHAMNRPSEASCDALEIILDECEESLKFTN